MRWRLEQILKKTGGGILLEDDSLIAINKPAGLLVLPDRYNADLKNLYKLLKETFGEIYVVHRIDRDTSGVVLFAKTPEVHAILNEAFEHRKIEKRYLAIVTGLLKDDEGSIDLPISEGKDGSHKMRVDEKHGKEARTDYKLIERIDKYALVEVHPYSGRTHQIRVHLSAAGMPILADPLYGSGEDFYLSSIKRNYQEKGEEQPLICRTALHAAILSFTHPYTKTGTRIEAPLPRDMGAVLKALRKYKRP